MYLTQSATSGVVFRQVEEMWDYEGRGKTGGVTPRSQERELRRDTRASPTAVCCAQLSALFLLGLSSTKCTERTLSDGDEEEDRHSDGHCDHSAHGHAPFDLVHEVPTPQRARLALEEEGCLPQLLRLHLQRRQRLLTVKDHCYVARHDRFDVAQLVLNLCDAC